MFKFSHVVSNKQIRDLIEKIEPELDVLREDIRNEKPGNYKRSLQSLERELSTLLEDLLMREYPLQKNFEQRKSSRKKKRRKSSRKTKRRRKKKSRRRSLRKRY
tara:strand:+ start:698 stop:1009 length:312 start_codon:yes stop_codon:yes gene_type:complete